MSTSRASLRADLSAGFLVSLVTLPLCMGIALASGFPAVAGVITSIIGGLVTGLLGGAPLTIKGAPAGLIVIVLAAVQELGATGFPEDGYRRALAVAVIAGLVQVGMALLKLGKMTSYFSSSVIHGMLAAIGVIVIAKQIHVACGVRPAGKSILELIAEIPHSLYMANPEVIAVSIIAIVAMVVFGHPKVRSIAKLPPAIIVAGLGIAAAWYFDFAHEHRYAFLGQEYEVSRAFLISLPHDLMNAIVSPNWDAVDSFVFWKHVVLFALVGAIESSLTVTAIDSVTRGQAQSDVNKDLRALGVANSLAGLIGGLPMISEVARSKANVDAGAKTHWANFTHGLCLLLAFVFFPQLIELIPSAALAGLLIYIGARLASPREFIHAYQQGMSSLVIFVITLTMTVSVDLLVGVASGFVASLVYWSLRAKSFRGLFAPEIAEQQSSAGVSLAVKGPAVYSGFAKVEKSIVSKLQVEKVVTVDLSKTRLVDNEFVSRLQTLSDRIGEDKLQVVGLRKAHVH